MRTSAVTPQGGAGAPPGRLALEDAIPPLLDRVAAVGVAIGGGTAPDPPPGFRPVPDGPPSRRERALLVQFAWTAYTVLAGRPPAAQPPSEFPWRLNAIVPLSQRRPDLLPTLARLVDRILTAPAMSALPSPAGLEELLRRTLGRPPAGGPSAASAARDPGPATAADVLAADRRPPVALQVDFAPQRPEPVAAVLTRLRGLLQPLRTCDDGDTADRRRALFRLAWSGWERLAASAPYPHDTPYVPRLGDPTPLPPLMGRRPDVPPALDAMLAQLLDQRVDHPDIRVAEVTAWLAGIADAAPGPGQDEPEGAPRALPPASAVALAAAAEADRLLDGFAATGLVRPGALASRARSIEERAAVAGLAWSVYESLTGRTPFGASGDGAYATVLTLAPDAPPALARLADDTLAPRTPGDLPGVVAWLAAAQAAAQAGAHASPQGGPPLADTVSAAEESPSSRGAAGRPRARPRRPVRLLPPQDPAPPSPAFLAAAAAVLAVIVRLVARAG